MIHDIVYRLVHTVELVHDYTHLSIEGTSIYRTVFPTQNASCVKLITTKIKGTLLFGTPIPLLDGVQFREVSLVNV